MSAYTEFPDQEAVAEEAAPITRERPEHDRRRRRNTLIGLSLSSIAIVGSYYALTPPGSINIEAAVAFDERNDEMSQIALALTGHGVRVACDDEILNEAGEQHVDGASYPTQGRVFPFDIFGNKLAVPVIVLRESVCDTILNENNVVPSGSFRSKNYDAPIQFARAVVTLLHEEEHTDQIFDEAEANCYAYQKLPGALNALGMNPAETPIVTHKLLDAMSGTAYAPSYYSDQCAPGGAFDLRISDAYLQK